MTVPTTKPSPSETLFKSSLRQPMSSSGHSHKAFSPPPQPQPQPSPSPTESWPPSHLSAEHLDHTQWSYLAEGGKNLLLRFDGDVQEARGSWVSPDARRAFAVRVIKTFRADGEKEDMEEASKKKKQEEDDEEEEDVPSRPEFEACILSPLLLSPSFPDLLPITRRIPLSTHREKLFLEKMAAKIEISRPRERRKTTGIDVSKEFVDLVEDLSWSWTSGAGEERMGMGMGMGMLGVEIKPKWLFSTSAHSRYKQHRVAKSQGKMTMEEWNQLYDPLDLVSGDRGRIQRAVVALVRDWQRGGNNLRVFVDGVAVRDMSSKQLQRILALVRNPSPSTSRNDDDDDASSEALISLLTPILTTSSVQKVLHRLAHLQSNLAPMDIHTLSTWWTAQTGGLPFPPAHTHTQEGQQAHAHLYSEPTLEEYKEFIADWLHLNPISKSGGEDKDVKGEKEEQTSERSQTSQIAITLRQAILGTLLSATLKDCSLFFRVGPFLFDKSNIDNNKDVEDTIDENDSTIKYRSSLLSKFDDSTTTMSTTSNSTSSPLLTTPPPPPPTTPTTTTTTIPYTLHLIDLDAKPIKKLSHWLTLEDQVQRSFESWKVDMDLN